MSDYLWDKTGEPDEDVEQLENLLGALKYQPRPLEIPATAMPTAARPGAGTTTTIFSRPRLAIAASLILTLLAGTWFVTRQNEPQAIQMAETGQGSSTVKSPQPESTVVSNNGANKNTSVNATVQSNLPEDGAGIIKVAVPKRQRVSRQLVAHRQKQQQQRVKEDAAVLPQREQLADAQAGREATEKLMLALRLASAKLNFAQRELQEISRANK